MSYDETAPEDPPPHFAPRMCQGIAVILFFIFSQPPGSRAGICFETLTAEPARLMQTSGWLEQSACLVWSVRPAQLRRLTAGRMTCHAPGREALTVNWCSRSRSSGRAATRPTATTSSPIWRFVPTLSSNLPPAAGRVGRSRMRSEFPTSWQNKGYNLGHCFGTREAYPRSLCGEPELAHLLQQAGGDSI